MSLAGAAGIHPSTAGGTSFGWAGSLMIGALLIANCQLIEFSEILPTFDKTWAIWHF
jgi:hypothetical protein